MPLIRCVLLSILHRGDPFYVGITGIELFDGSGHPIIIDSPATQVWADPSDINVLPEYTNDPRVAENVVDGHCHTCSDLHAWLAPFEVRSYSHVLDYLQHCQWGYDEPQVHWCLGYVYTLQPDPSLSFFLRAAHSVAKIIFFALIWADVRR